MASFPKGIGEAICVIRSLSRHAAEAAAVGLRVAQW